MWPMGGLAALNRHLSTPSPINISICDSTNWPIIAGTPMASRNLPPSFFNAHYHAKLAYSHPESSGLYSDAYTQVATKINTFLEKLTSNIML